MQRVSLKDYTSIGPQLISIKAKLLDTVLHAFIKGIVDPII